MGNGGKGERRKRRKWWKRRGPTLKRGVGNFLAWQKCSISWLWHWLHDYVHISKVTKLSTQNVWTLFLLYVTYTIKKLILKNLMNRMFIKVPYVLIPHYLKPLLHDTEYKHNISYWLNPMASESLNQTLKIKISDSRWFGKRL